MGEGGTPSRARGKLVPRARRTAWRSPRQPEARLLPTLFITACGGAPDDEVGAVPADSGADDAGDVTVAYAEGDGPFAVRTEDGTVAGQGVTWFVPEGAQAPPVVLWSHGFARSRSFHAESARHAASWGLLVVTADLPSPYGGHAENAAFLAGELLDAAGARPEAGTDWAYVGHSAGGLATVLATAEVGAGAVVALDAVDADDLGLDAAGEVLAPTLRLVGEPSSCNASGNAREWRMGGTDWLVSVTDATHCDFENPTDALCTAVCGAKSAARQAVVGEYATAWLVHALIGGADPWILGEKAEADRAEGSIDFE